MDFLAQLKKLCDDYDSYHGQYPESIYEGESIYDFAKKQAQTNAQQPQTEIRGVDVDRRHHSAEREGSHDL